MPLTFAGVVRYSIVGNLFGEECVNVFDVALTTGSGISRADGCFTTAGDILNNWTDHILPLVSAGYEAREVRWVDLNSLNGSTGTRSATDAESWPQSGALEANTLPNNVYAKVTKQVEGKSRQERNGTTRLGGIVESFTTGANANQMDATSRGNIDAGFEAFKDGVNGEQVAGNTTNLCVLHTVNGVATGRSFISSFTTSSTVGTLRRRMPGYGS